MSVEAARRCEERFLILAPTGRDAALTQSFLEEAGMCSAVCRDMSEVCQFVAEGALGLLLAQEALTRQASGQLKALLSGQPAWSDLPIVLFSGSGDERSRPLLPHSHEPLFNVTLLERPLRPVTMLSAANAALRARRRQYLARDELKAQQEQVRQRDQFLAMLGHELRNPLSAITMAVELDGDENAAQYRGIVKRQARHLTRLVDDLLDVARVTSGKIALQRTRFDLAELTRRVLLAMNPALAQNQLVVHAALPDEPVLVHGDVVRLEQVLVNLLNNAVKYTPAGGRVEVALVPEPERVELRVSDTGVGIAPGMLPRVFDLFAQAEGTLDRSKGGMGIGLTLVKSLMQLHGGGVEARSEGLGRGSTFILRLPRGVVSEERPAPPASPARHEGPAREVLIIEDNDDSRELLASILQRRGHHVLTAADGSEGVALALAQRPSAVLVDIGLPGLDGYGVARALRPELGREALLIAVTGYGQPEDKSRALDAGFDLHLTKPIDLGRLELALVRSTQH